MNTKIGCNKTLGHGLQCSTDGPLCDQCRAVQSLQAENEQLREKSQKVLDNWSFFGNTKQFADSMQELIELLNNNRNE